MSRQDDTVMLSLAKNAYTMLPPAVQHSMRNIIGTFQDVQAITCILKYSILLRSQPSKTTHTILGIYLRHRRDTGISGEYKDTTPSASYVLSAPV